MNTLPQFDVGAAAPLGLSGGSRPSARLPASGFASQVDTLSPAEWDDLAAGFADASLDQTAAYADGRWGERRSSHLVVRSGNAIVAAARAIIVKVPGLPVGLARVKYGPMWRRRGAASDPAVFAAALTALVEEYCGRRRLSLGVQMRPSAVSNDAERTMLLAARFRLRREVADPNRYLVTVDPDRVRARASLAQKWRYNLKKAEGNGLEIGFADDAEGVAAFAGLHAAMVSRKRASGDDPLHLMPRLAALPEVLRPRIVLARHDGRPIAGAVVAPAGDTAYYLFGASDDEALPLKAGYALHWWILDWLAGAGFRFYDLGGEVGAPGLRQFKKGMVGRDGSVQIMPGTFEFARSPASRLFVGGLFAARAGLGALKGLVRRAPAADPGEA